MDGPGIRAKSVSFTSDTSMVRFLRENVLFSCLSQVLFSIDTFAAALLYLAGPGDTTLPSYQMHLSL